MRILLLITLLFSMSSALAEHTYGDTLKSWWHSFQEKTEQLFDNIKRTFKSWTHKAEEKAEHIEERVEEGAHKLEHEFERK